MAMEIASQSALNPDSSESIKKITAQIVTWTSSFVLLTLIINAPSLPWLLRVCGLLEQSASKKKIMAKVHNMLVRKTGEIVEDLKADEDEMFRGVDWSAVTDASRENIGLPSTNKPSSRTWFAESLSGVARALSKTLRSGRQGEQHADIEEPLISNRESDRIHEILENNPRRKYEGLATRDETGTPFVTHVLEKAQEPGQSRQQTWNPGAGSNASTGWSSPVQAMKPDASDLQGWWGASIRGDDGSTNKESVLSFEGLAEARTRMMWGIKRYIYSKRQEGLLSPDGARILAYACDSAIEDSGNSLDIWTSVNKELAERTEIQAAAWVFHSTRMLIYSSPAALQKTVERIMKFSTSWLGVFLGKAMLQSCEVAIAYYMALCYAKQSQWLEINHKDSILYNEVQVEKQKVYNFIIDREIEAPAHFEAMQTYRASMAVMKRQLAYIETIYDAGIISDNEKEHISSSIQRRKQVLEVLGPTGTKWQSSGNVLLSLPIFRGLKDSVVQTILEHGALKEFGDGDVIWEDANNNPAYAFCLIIRGLVQVVSISADGEEEIDLKGSGAMLGILPAITMSQTALPGWKYATAQSSRLQKGVLVFFFPSNVFREVQVRAKEGQQQFQAMLLEIQREAAMNIHDATKSTILQTIASEYEKTEKESMAKIHEILAKEDDSLGEPIDEASQQAVTKRMQSKGRDYAAKVEAQIRRQIPHTICVILEPYETFVQRSHFILLFGSIQKQESSPTSQPKKLSRKLSMGLKIQAPRVVPLLDQQYMSDNSSSKAIPYLSGHQGAIIMICPFAQGSGQAGDGFSLDDADRASVSFFGDSMPSLEEYD